MNSRHHPHLHLVQSPAVCTCVCACHIGRFRQNDRPPRKDAPCCRSRPGCTAEMYMPLKRKRRSKSRTVGLAAAGKTCGLPDTSAPLHSAVPPASLLRQTTDVSGAVVVDAPTLPPPLPSTHHCCPSPTGTFTQLHPRGLYTTRMCLQVCHLGLGLPTCHVPGAALVCPTVMYTPTTHTHLRVQPSQHSVA